jgi:uncharacterized membrane protein YiaA
MDLSELDEPHLFPAHAATCVPRPARCDVSSTNNEDMNDGIADMPHQCIFLHTCTKHNAAEVRLLTVGAFSAVIAFIDQFRYG